MIMVMAEIPGPPVEDAFRLGAPHRGSVLLVLVCTLLGAAAQLLMKAGGNGFANLSWQQLLAHPELLLRNLPLLAGYLLYGLSTVLLVLALRKGELSLLYPVIALTYVWVLVASAIVFHEQVNSWKIAGVLSIVTGVGVLGRGESA